MQIENSTKTAKTIEVIDNFEVGRQFEEYIINLFNPQFFEITEYNKSQKKKPGQILPGNHSATNTNPDMTLMLFGNKKYRFAIECKYRTRFYGDELDWAYEHQIKNYKDFRKLASIPVFVAIGVGGHPSNPNELVVTPLEYIEMSTIALKSDLLPYKKRSTRKFYYDIDSDHPKLF